MISCQSDKLTSDLILHTQQAYMTGLPLTLILLSFFSSLKRDQTILDLLVIIPKSKNKEIVTDLLESDINLIQNQMAACKFAGQTLAR